MKNIAVYLREVKKRPAKILKNALYSLQSNGKKISRPLEKNLLITVMGIIRGGRARLVEISEKMVFQQVNCAKSLVNRLSYHFAGDPNRNERVETAVKLLYTHLFTQGLRYLKNELVIYKGKMVGIIDWTTYRKRARQNKNNKGMEYVGKIHDSRLNKQVTGYGGLLTGLLLKGRRFLPAGHKLYSNRYVDQHPEEYGSINQFEDEALDELREMVGENLLIMGDTHFSRKDFLSRIKKNRMDFLMRIIKGVNVKDGQGWINIWEKSKKVRKTHHVFWYYPERKKHIDCYIKLFKTKLFIPREKIYLPIWVITLEAFDKRWEPMIIVSSLRIVPKDLQSVVNLYKQRWTIETTFEDLKQNFGLEKIMVRKWKAINTMAYLVLISYIVLLILWLTSKKIVLSTVTIFLKRRTILSKGKLSLGKWRWGISKLFCEPKINLFSGTVVFTCSVLGSSL